MNNSQGYVKDLLVKYTADDIGVTVVDMLNIALAGCEE